MIAGEFHLQTAPCALEVFPQTTKLPDLATEGPKIFRSRVFFKEGRTMCTFAARTAFLLVLPLLALPLLSSGACAQTNASPAIQQRMKWQDFVSGPDGAKRLASLTAAVAKMKSLDNSPVDSADFRRSWKYWANIHGYLGPDSPFNTVAFQKDRLNSLQLSQFLPYLVGT